MSARIRSPLPLLGGVLALYLAAPIVIFLMRLGHGVTPTDGVQDALFTSLVTATVSTAIIAILGVPLAYALARSRGWLASAVTLLVALPLALPPLMSGVLLLDTVGPNTPLGRLFGGGLTDTAAGIVLAQTFVAAPFLVIAARAAFAGADPELEDVARTLGLRPVSRFLRVATVAAWPGIQAGLLLAWLRAFGEFGATVILAYHPYSLPVFTFVQFGSTGVPGTTLPVAAALGAALLLLTLLQLHGRRPRATATLPAAMAPPPRSPASLRFALEKRLATFSLQLEYAAQTPRLALLGPSGSGKTMTLRLLAGIAAADRADVVFGTRALDRLPAQERDIGYLPQHSALLPRRTVWRQVLLAADAHPTIAAWWLQRLELTDLAHRLPHELSGGQQRRVALARALARAPSLVLLDEPFSAVDAPLRHQLVRDLRRIQRDSGIATVLVTHDPDEAAMLADEVVVISDGRALQHGRMTDVFAHPASALVASLLGIANRNVATVQGPGCIRCSGVDIAAPTGDLQPGALIEWAVRAEDVAISAHGRYRATVVDAVEAGGFREATIAISGLELTVREGRVSLPATGAVCCVDLPPDAIMVWPGREGEIRTRDLTVPNRAL